MGDDGLARAVGIGNVCLETNMGTKLALKGLKHMPDMRLHLISTDRLDIKGFCNTFNNGQWKLTKDAMIVARDLDPTPPQSIAKQVCNKAHEDHDGIIDPDVPISVEIYYDVLKDPEVSSSIVLRRSNRDKHLPM
ncbi:hypothetical protein Patl1_13882 [Pistacia atlantica]|uniref:Uncharacterized protein n=1 Tax=Pistacia atlantica TaxID=434234 RepID=A0ACC1AVC0_9ROSI|nr:hypothetical protein Patl1_13882 [Pistacia atlantica]